MPPHEVNAILMHLGTKAIEVKTKTCRNALDLKTALGRIQLSIYF